MNYKKEFSTDPGSYSERLKTAEVIFALLQKEYSLENFNFEVSPRLRTALGICQYNRYRNSGTVKVSKLFLQGGNWIGVIDTILHECAHAIDFNNRGTSKHDWTWKRIAKAIGAEPNRLASHAKVGQEFLADVKKSAKYTLECPGCGATSYQLRKTKRVYGCSTCNTSDLQRERGFLPFKVIQNY